MKPSRFILLTLIMALLLVACERPAPTGELPPPADSGTESLPRPDESYPASETDQTGAESTEAESPDVNPDTTEGETSPESSEETPTTEGEESSPTDSTESEAETDDETAVEPPALEDGIYVVRDGDTMGQIAFIFGVSVEDIMAANDLANPDVLSVGQELVIPEAGFADTAAADEEGETDETASEDPPADSGGEEQIHIVQAGDNLYRIGLRYGFTIDELAEYNNLTDVNNLEIGQEIRIPPSN